MPYYKSDLAHYITKDFYKISWKDKILRLQEITNGLANIHIVNIVHRDLHSGNILLDDNNNAKICDLGISKSATDNNDNEDNVYGIIPYVAPEVLQGKMYTKASDIYSFGMIMWELMVGRRPFWDRYHDTELIIDIYVGLRPPIVTNAPEGYIDLMKECWHSDPEKRPTAVKVFKKIREIFNIEKEKNNRLNETKIIESPDIGPVATNNSGAIYSSRYLSNMTTSTRSQESGK
jgi:serine/threonine protein kinase